MSRYTNLAVLVSLAACERADLATTTPAPQFDPPAQPEAMPREPVKPAEPAVAPVVVEPAEPVAQPRIKTERPLLDQQLLDRRCLTRAGCRWKGERELPRVVKQPVAAKPDPTR